MKKIVLKKNPEKKSMWEILKILFHKIFKERVVITTNKGKFTYYKFSATFQFMFFSIIIFLTFWTITTTKMYILNKEILKQKDLQVQDARNKFNKVVADIKAYKDTINTLSKKFEISDNNIVNILSKDEKLSELEKDTLLKSRALLSSELKYVNSNLNTLTKNMRWASTDTKTPYYTNTKNSLERDIVLNENVYLKKQNNTLEKSLSDMKQLQDNLIEKVSVLADDKINDIEKVLVKVDDVLAQVQLKNRKTLVRKVEQAGDFAVGGKYIPLTDMNLDSELLNQKYKNVNAKINLWEGLSKAKMMLPLGAPVKKIRITSQFGVREDPFFKTPAMHTGIDFGGKEGTPLYATAPGKVIQAGRRGDYGLCVEVDHGLGFTTLYGHLSKVNVEKGDYIDEGTKVGLAGSTGRSTGPHLHYELRHNNRILNPYTFVKAK